MKYIIVIFVLVFVVHSCEGQNLVPNGDFENYKGCPTNLGQLDSLNFWQKPTIGSSDYFNSCATGVANVPNTYYNYQNARSGFGMAGIILYHNTVFEYREYISVKLTEILVKDECYFFEMYVNLFNDCLYAADDLGVYFSDTLGTQNASLHLPFVPQIYNSNGAITDTLGWTLVSGYLRAVGGEQYLTIGNFNNDNNTNKVLLTNQASNNKSATIFIDDVSFSKSISSNCVPTQLTNSDKGNFKVYPNPIINAVTFESNINQLYSITIFDILGNNILNKKFNGNARIEMEYLPKGFYFYRVSDSLNNLKYGTLIKK